MLHGIEKASSRKTNFEECLTSLTDTYDVVHIGSVYIYNVGSGDLIVVDDKEGQSSLAKVNK